MSAGGKEMNVEGEWRDGFRSFTDHQLEKLEESRMVNAKSLVASGSETRLSIGDRRHRIASYGQMWNVIKRNWTSNMRAPRKIALAGLLG